MLLNLNFAECPALRNGAVRRAFSADQAQINSRVFAPTFDGFFIDGAPPGVPMN